jgi:hypothetical protein
MDPKTPVNVKPSSPHSAPEDGGRRRQAAREKNLWACSLETTSWTGERVEFSIGPLVGGRGRGGRLACNRSDVVAVNGRLTVSRFAVAR